MASGQSNADRQLEEALGALIKFIWKMIYGFFSCLFSGIRKLCKWQTWIGLCAAILIALCTRFVWQDNIFKLQAPEYIRWMIYIGSLCAPVIYLLLLGGDKEHSKVDYEKLFRDIGFVGKNGECPKFKSCRMDGKKKILIFQSYIPLEEWMNARARLETALDCTILKMENGKSKRLVHLTVLPADFELSKNIPWSDSYASDKDGIITIGQSALGNVSFNLNRVPHALAAGETGSGKSVILRVILRQMVLQSARVFMIDFKGGVEFGKQYERFGEVITERERALEVLDMLVKENECRLKLFREMEVKNLSEYNKKVDDMHKLCRIGLFTDEIAEMLDKKGVSKEIRQIYEALEGKISTLARLSRATGINLFLGIQRPDATVLTGQIKNNIPIRICGRFADKSASEIVLGNTDAVMLPDIKGRFLYKMGNETIEFQAFYFDDDTMLHDVNVEVGHMLINTPVYEPGNNILPGKTTQKKHQNKKKNSIHNEIQFGKKKMELSEKRETQPEEIYLDSEIYQDIEEELPFGPAIEVDEYDFDFFRDSRKGKKGEDEV